MAVLEAGRTLATRGRRGWEELTRSEQRELQRLLRVSRGRPRALTERERSELRRIVLKGVRAAARRS